MVGETLVLMLLVNIHVRSVRRESWLSDFAGYMFLKSTRVARENPLPFTEYPVLLAAFSEAVSQNHCSGTVGDFFLDSVKALILQELQFKFGCCPVFRIWHGF